MYGEGSLLAINADKSLFLLSRNPVQHMQYSEFLGQFHQTESKLVLYRNADLKRSRFWIFRSKQKCSKLDPVHTTLATDQSHRI